MPLLTALKASLTLSLVLTCLLACTPSSSLSKPEPQPSVSASNALPAPSLSPSAESSPSTRPSLPTVSPSGVPSSIRPESSAPIYRLDELALSSASAGQRILLHGSGLQQITLVTAGGKAIALISQSDSLIEFKLPSGLVSGPLSLSYYIDDVLLRSDTLSYSPGESKGGGGGGAGPSSNNSSQNGHVELDVDLTLPQASAG